MKIEATCRNCGRDITGDQIARDGAECPWCGIPFSADYALVFVNAIREAQEAGTRLEASLEQLADLAPEIRVEETSVLDEIRRSLGRIARPAIRQP